MIEAYERKHHQGHYMDLITVLMNTGQRIKVEPKSIRIEIPAPSEMVNRDAELPPAAPCAGPKDGDHISLHEGHEIVTASAGGEAYKYCRTCKVEVKEGSRVFTGRNAMDDVVVKL
jgi:biotin carboxyl carrier protein